MACTAFPSYSAATYLMKATASLVLMLAVLALTGCRSISPQPGMPRLQPGTSRLQGVSGADTNAATAPVAGKWHSIVVPPGRNLPPIDPCRKFNPIWWFGNADEPVAPAWYRPNKKFRNLTWYFRNPLHNFDNYVIGITGKEFVRSGRYPESIGNPHGGWNYAVSKYKRLRLPMISYTRKWIDFYFGWRTHGSFGIKININPAPKRKPASSKVAP
jgi:hypothetical protein